MSEIKIIKKKLGKEALIIKPVIVGEESEEMKDYTKEEFVAVHQMFMENR